jgi:hypothetical protein
MKQGPFARAGLCCPTAATATTAPSDSLWAAVHFPGPPVIGRRCFPGRRPGAQEGLSSSQDNLSTVPRPLRRGVLEHPPQEPGCRPWPSPSRHGLGSPLARPGLPGGGVNITTLQASLHAADRPIAHPHGVIVAPLRRRPLDRRREPRYRGPWCLPGPDSHRLAALSLPPGYIRTSLPSGCPDCWTYAWIILAVASAARVVASSATSADYPRPRIDPWRSGQRGRRGAPR